MSLNFQQFSKRSTSFFLAFFSVYALIKLKRLCVGGGDIFFWFVFTRKNYVFKTLITVNFLWQRVFAPFPMDMRFAFNPRTTPHVLITRFPCARQIYETYFGQVVDKKWIFFKVFFWMHSKTLSIWDTLNPRAPSHAQTPLHIFLCLIASNC